VTNKSPETLKSSTAAIMRALSGRKELEVSFSPAEPPTGRLPPGNVPRLPLPALSNDPAQNAASITLLRGCADVQALYLAHHDEKIFRQTAPRDIRAYEAFQALEQARCEALGITTMHGVAENLARVLDEKCRRAGYDSAASAEQINLPDALHLIARISLTGDAPPPAAAHTHKLLERFFKERMGETDFAKAFAGLKPLLQDQKAFAAASGKILSSLGLTAAPPEQPQENQIQPDDNESQTPPPKDGEDTAPESDDAQSLPESMSEGETEDSAQSLQAEQQQSFEDALRPEDASTAANPQFQRSNDYIKGPDSRYHVYTNTFDEEVGAETLAEPEELQRLRTLLDKQLAQYHTVITKLANRLQRKLMAKQQRSWQFDMEEGILDTSRLSRIISNPNIPLTYKKELETDFKDTIVTLLIDNSGSMRGRPIAIAAMSADIIARTLERCGVRTEILGFTTRAWKGGKARDLWMQNGRPPEPGRLNDIRHIIYKAAEAPMRRMRRNLGLMLKEGILKENIDGEALVWAHNRLAQRQESRKILMVISDGAPVDDSTLSVNPANFLEQDLRNVIDWIEARSDIELTAIGIGHDVTRYYRRAITIRDADELAGALIGQLAELFDTN
jgi:cobaltochelatase CobT